MKKRFIALLFAAAVLVCAVCVLQSRLQVLSEKLANKTDEIALLFAQEKTDLGLVALSDFTEELARYRPFFGLTVSDSEIHEIDRALFRARRLGEAGEIDPVL